MYLSLKQVGIACRGELVHRIVLAVITAVWFPTAYRSAIYCINGDINVALHSPVTANSQHGWAWQM